MKSLTRLALPVALALGLSACATNTFKADVSRFAVPLPAPQGQTFAVVAEDPKLAGGLEFATYANSVAEELTQRRDGRRRIGRHVVRIQSGACRLDLRRLPEGDDPRLSRRQNQRHRLVDGAPEQPIHDERRARGET